MVLSATRGSGSDIFRVDLASRSSQRLTNSGSIDTSPCFSPDGSQIVFNSDRGGSPQLYVMGAGGGAARRISYGSGQYGSPVWSPRGDLIAFTRIGGSGFSIGVMQPDGTGERILTQGFTVESPTFCPNGRVMAYCRQSCGRRRRCRVLERSGDHRHRRLQRSSAAHGNRRVGPSLVADQRVTSEA